METKQKRAALRIPPPKEFLIESAIWCGKTMPQGEQFHDITTWLAPKLLLRPGNKEQFQFMDISANGARIHIPGTVFRTLDLHFSANEQLLLALDLLDPEYNKGLRFWMQCLVQSAWVNRATRIMDVGLQFSSWARLRKNVPGNPPKTDPAAIEWLHLPSANGIETLGNWIMRRHLELFRKNSEKF
jgi:hypothetical protein